MIRILIACSVVMLSAFAMAAEIELLNVDRDGKILQVDSVLVIDAPRDLVFAALSDYDAFSGLSERYKQSRFIDPAADGTPRVYTAVEGCVWFFCRTVERYARLELTPDEKIVATVEPEQSDFKAGLEQWLLEDDPAGTRVSYTHTMQPDFWIPPLLGVWGIRRALEADALSAANRIEALALRQKQGAQNSRVAPEPE
jgi:hypothetical protein